MRIRQRIVRIVNKIRGVEARELDRMHHEANVMYSTLALHLGVSLTTIYDWEAEYTPIPKVQYEKAMRYLRDRAEQAERATRATAAGIRTKAMNRDESGAEFDV